MIYFFMYKSHVNAVGFVLMKDTFADVLLCCCLVCVTVFFMLLTVCFTLITELLQL